MLRLCNVVDEFTREALVMHVERSIKADTVVALLEGLVAERGAPEHPRMDNGPEMTAHALVGWCTLRRNRAAYIDAGSPWQNPDVESFHSRVRDELLDIEEFSCLTEARVVIGDWQEDYNHRQPHGSLRMRTPVAFAAEHGIPPATLGPLAYPDPGLEPDRGLEPDPARLLTQGRRASAPAGLNHVLPRPTRGAPRLPPGSR